MGKCVGVGGGEENCGEVLGKVWHSVLGCWGGEGMWESVREGVGKCVGMRVCGEVLGEVWESVLEEV